MTQQEKTRLRLKCLNRRYRGLILRLLLPILLLQPLCSPLYYYLYLLYHAEPSAPIVTRYVNCSWIGGHGLQNHLLLEVDGGLQYDLHEDAGLLFWEDVSSLRIVPGDTLQLTTYPWSGNDRIATLNASDRVYATWTEFEEGRLRDIRIRKIGWLLVQLGGLLCGIILFLFQRPQFAEIRRLRKECQ